MSSMHPVLALYLKIVAVVAVGIVALFLMAVIAKILVLAALVAAVALGGLFLYSVFRRRQQLPTAK